MSVLTAVERQIVNVEDAEAVFENNRLELQRFIYGDMSEEEGTEYLGGIGWVLILGPEQEPLGFMGQTDWGWIDTLNETAHFLLPRGYETKLIPELDDWGFDTRIDGQHSRIQHHWLQQ